LRDVFDTKFNFETEFAELNVDEMVQTQLESAILSFTQRKAKPHNLVIVYYTGHGWYDDDRKELIFVA